MKPISGLLTGGVLPAMLLVAACSATGETSPPQAAVGSAHDRPGTERRHADITSRAANQGAPTDADHHHARGTHTAGSHADAASAPLSAALFSAADLPPGYRAGTHHQSPGGRPPRVSAACTPISQVIGAHPSGQQHQHPQVRVSFSKSHFGPQMSETIIGYGNPAAASQAVRDLARASQECDRYVQSTSPVGANTYTVRSTPDAHSRHPGHHGPGSTALRLDATGQQFAGLHWDIWATSSGSRFAAVAFRSVPGGDNDDWHAAIRAAQDALDGRGSHRSR